MAAIVALINENDLQVLSPPEVDGTQKRLGVAVDGNAAAAAATGPARAAIPLRQLTTGL